MRSRKGRRPPPRLWDGYTKFVVVPCLCLAALLLVGFAQSGTRTEWTSCKVDVRPVSGSDESGKKKVSKLIFCKRDTVVIAVRRENQLPHTPDTLLTHENVLSCSYEVVRNKLNLFTEQIDNESLDCSAHADTG